MLSRYFYQNLNSEKLKSSDISYKESLDNFITKNPMKKLSDVKPMLLNLALSSVDSIFW